MLPDNRLDFITNIKQVYIDKMTRIRQEYIVLDDMIKDMTSYAAYEALGENVPAALRCASIARTNLETSLQYAIKTLCLIGEQKE